MKSTIKSFMAAVLTLLLGMGTAVTAFATNTFTINDPAEIAFPSGYDIKSVTFTLGADYSLTADIVPFGVPGDTDGDGNPNSSSNGSIVDEPGVGLNEYLEIDMECGATDVSNGCNPNVIVIYTDNTLTVYNLLNGVDLTPYVTFTVLADRYVMTIPDLLAFKTALGISTTAVNFGAFHFVASFADNQDDDQIPDNGACAAVHLDPPEVATCNLLVTKTANVSTVGPLPSPVGNENDDDDDDNENYQSTSSLTCGCKGKVSKLVLRYNGTTPTTVKVDRIDPFATNLVPSTAVLPGDLITVNASNFGPNGFKGTLGTGIRITENGGNPVEIHTSCSVPIGPGTVAGDFVVESGTSKKLSVPLCPIVPSDSCPANQKVTYTYTVTNNGTALTGVVLTDDKLVAPVSGPVDMAANASATYTVDACLYQTTTNVASATGTLSDNKACVSNTSSVTVEMLENKPPVCHNDDPPPVEEHHGCSADYYGDNRKHKKSWGKHKPDEHFDAVFGVDASGNKGLLKCLNETELSGKGYASKSLQREAAAAMLNANNPKVNYLYTPGEVIKIVGDAYASKSYDAATQLLKTQNGKGCPADANDD